MIHIFIADDHAIVREGLKQILSDTSDMKVVDEADNGAETLNKLLHNDYDIVIKKRDQQLEKAVEVLMEEVK